jgi:hypothetical protein
MVAILSSGKFGQIEGSDGSQLSDMEILQKFGNSSAPKLAGKPKISYSLILGRVKVFDYA